MADSHSDKEETSDTVVSLLKSLNDTVTKLDRRIVSLENDMKNHDNHSNPPSPRTSVHAHEDDRIHNAHTHTAFEPSLPSENEEDDSESELTFKDTIFAKNVGDNINEPLAQALQISLLGVDDTKKIMNIHENNPRPGNVTGLIVPELNKEIGATDKPISVTSKENQLCGIQRNLCTAISILSNILNDVGKRKNRTLSREDIFQKTNDAVSVLAAAHKGVNLARKMNIKPILSQNIQFLCTKSHTSEEDRSSNKFLFDEDLGSECDKAYKQRRVIHRISKNFGAQGRGSFRNGAGRGSSQIQRGVSARSRSQRGRSYSRRGRGNPYPRTPQK